MIARRLDSRYSRILGVGLGLSLAAHAAVLALGHFGVEGEEPADKSLEIVTLADLDVAPEEWERLQPAKEAEFSGYPAPLPVPEPNSMHAEAEAPYYAPAAEHEIVLAAAAAADLETPLVPQPRLDAVVAESGWTPIHVLEPIALGTGDRGEESSGAGGFFVSFGAGGGVCAAPAFVNRRLPLRQAGLNRLQLRAGR
jgi:hypothetical protein